MRFLKICLFNNTILLAKKKIFQFNLILLTSKRNKFYTIHIFCDLLMNISYFQTHLTRLRHKSISLFLPQICTIRILLDIRQKSTKFFQMQKFVFLLINLYNWPRCTPISLHQIIREGTRKFQHQ